MNQSAAESKKSPLPTSPCDFSLPHSSTSFVKEKLQAPRLPTRLRQSAEAPCGPSLALLDSPGEVGSKHPTCARDQRNPLYLDHPFSPSCGASPQGDSAMGTPAGRVDTWNPRSWKRVSRSDRYVSRETVSRGGLSAAVAAVRIFAEASPGEGGQRPSVREILVCEKPSVEAHECAERE